MSKVPIIGITCGDINGVGTEILVKSSNKVLLQDLIIIFFGSIRLWNFYEKLIDLSKKECNVIKTISEAKGGQINIIDCWASDIQINPGVTNVIGGKSAYQSLLKATDSILHNEIDILITMPLSKHTMPQPFIGHTEYLQNKFNVKENLMFLVSDQLKIATVTNHVPINLVSTSITKKNIDKKLNILEKSLKKDFLITNPKIAVLGLNPHVGDNQLIGKEDYKIISPLLSEKKKKGINVFGPYSADSFFGRQLYKNFDAVLAMYHDQGLVPFKMLSCNGGVNYTAGMPIIRTSPDHGPAYDITGKGIVNCNSFLQAVLISVNLYNNKV